MSFEMSVLDPILAAVQSLVRQALDNEQAQPDLRRKGPLAAVDPSSGSRAASQKSNSSPGSRSAVPPASQWLAWKADMQGREAPADSGSAGSGILRLQPQRKRKVLSQQSLIQRGAGPVQPHHSAPLPLKHAQPQPPAKAPRSCQYPDHPWVPQLQAQTHSMGDRATPEHSSSQTTAMPMASKQPVQQPPESGLPSRLKRLEACAAGPATRLPAGGTPLRQLLSAWDNPCVAPISSIPRLQDLNSLNRVRPGVTAQTFVTVTATAQMFALHPLKTNSHMSATLAMGAPANQCALLHAGRAGTRDAHQSRARDRRRPKANRPQVPGGALRGRSRCQ